MPEFHLVNGDSRLERVNQSKRIKEVEDKVNGFSTDLSGKATKEEVNVLHEQLVDTAKKIDGVFNVVEFGASSEKTDTENKTSLQDAIAYVDSIGGGHIVIPYDISYGYNRNDIATHPNFSATTTDIMVTDYSKGKTYTGEGQREGSQIRTFFTTSGDETDGFHDGNGRYDRGAWHPYYAIMNDGVTGQTSNRRATYWVGNNGEVTWGFGQGVNTVTPDGTNIDDLLSAFKIVGNKVAGGTGLETFLVILKTNGYWGFGTQDPIYEYHMRSKRGTHGRWYFERQGSGDIYFHFKTSSKERKIQIRDSDGLIRFTNSAGNSNVFDLTDEGNAKFTNGVNGGSFTTAGRPTNVGVGTMIFDSTLGKPIWLKTTPSTWVDATGTTV